jgi:indolepyruvate ferredoxin oxidoreductase beta subunit
MPISSHSNGGVSSLKDVWSIVICGVGGQGVVSTGRVLANAAILMGMKAKGTEIVGGAQRGGPVLCHVRLGPSIDSSIIPRKMADVVLALEPVEAMRVSPHLVKDGGAIVFNEAPVYPITVQVGRERYPSLEEIESYLLKVTRKVFSINASRIAVEEVGSVVVANMILLGFMSSLISTPISVEALLRSIEDTLPRSILDLNLKAFRLGLLLGERVENGSDIQA